MNEFSGLGKLLIVVGVIIIAAGVVLWFGGRIPWLGKLPGDFTIKRGNFTFYFPWVTSILLSVLLTIILALLRRR